MFISAYKFIWAIIKELLKNEILLPSPEGLGMKSIFIWHHRV